MKKTIIMAMAVIFSATAFAQGDAAKQILKMKDYDQAAALLKSNLSTMSAEAKAKCYNKLVDISWEAISKEAQAETQSEDFYDALYNAYHDASECNKYDNQPNDKGQVKPKFMTKNRDRLYTIRPYLINGGETARQHNDYQRAYKFWGMYVDSYNDPLFAEVDKSDDKYVHDIAYYAAVLAMQVKDREGVDRYTDIAMQDPGKANEAMELKLAAASEGLKTKADSIAFTEKVEAAFEKNPKSELVFGTLVNMYTDLGMDDKLESLFNKKLAEDPNNFTVWTIRGQKAMQKQELDQAIEHFRKAITAQPENPQVLTFLGACLLDKASKAEEKIKGRITPAAKQQIDPFYEEAKTHLEKAKQIDPQKAQAKWGYPLYRCYYALYGANDNRTKAAEADAN